MKVIQHNCRVQFGAEDVDFILSVLGRKVGGADCLLRLLADEDSRDLILDDEALFETLINRRGCLQVSSRFYFYILVRHVFRRAGVEDRTVADYVAEVLTEFARTENAKCLVPGQANPIEYLFEMLFALRTADERTSFAISAHIGNYSLFFSGLFPEYIQFRAEARGFPDVSYYDALGRTHYRAASDSRLARKYDMEETLNTLSERFETTRCALNDIADRLFSIGDVDYSLENLLGQAKDSAAGN